MEEAEQHEAELDLLQGNQMIHCIHTSICAGLNNSHEVIITFAHQM